MKIRIGIIYLLMAITVYSHNHSNPLNNGEFLVGWNILPTAGFENIIFSNELPPDTKKIVVDVLTTEYRTAYMGTALSVEYGLTNSLAIGLKSNLFDMLVWGIRDKYWKVQGSLFANLYINDLFSDTDNPLKLFYIGELQLSPIYTDTEGQFGDGVLNLFNTLSLNLNLYKSQAFRFDIYTDVKVITSFLHPYYTYKWMTKAFHIEGAGLTTKEEDLELINNPGSKFVLAPGIDIDIFNFTLFIGINLPLVRTVRDINNDIFFQTSEMFPLGVMGLVNQIEIEWKYRY